MEQETNQGEGQDNNVQENAVTPDHVEALQKQLDKLAASNARLLDESKEYKSKWKAVKQEKDLEVRSKLEEQGNLSELVTELKNDIAGLKSQNNELKKTTLSKDLRVEVARYANDAFDIEDVVRNLPKGVLSMDEDNLTFDNVQDAVSAVRENKPHLFNNRPVTGMAGGRPSADVPKPKTFEDLTSEEQDAAFVEALKRSGL